MEMVSVSLDEFQSASWQTHPAPFHSEIKVNSLFCPGGREKVILRDICHVRSSPSRTLLTPPRSSSLWTTWKARAALWFAAVPSFKLHLFPAPRDPTDGSYMTAHQLFDRSGESRKKCKYMREASNSFKLSKVGNAKTYEERTINRTLANKIQGSPLTVRLVSVTIRL